MKFTIKQVSNLEKIIYDTANIAELKGKKTVMKGESFSYQIAMQSTNNAEIKVEINSPIKDNVTLYAVKNAIMDLPVYTSNDEFFPAPDDDFITKTPGIMPDILVPFEMEDNHIRLYNNTGALWVNVNIPNNLDAGEYPVTLKISYTEECEKRIKATFESEQTMIFDVINKELPEQQTLFTQWFHVDCISDVHNVPVYSEEHWNLIDKYMKMASDLGVNVILTPVITPPLDTGVGITRPCTQLVKIEKNGNTYSFDFSLLKRWVDLAKKNKMKYFEICHLFSQWGVEYAPNIKVTENGVEDYMFGWHTKANSKEYGEFLKQFIPALIDFFKKEGVKENCFFHISDEPHIEHVEAYSYAYNIIKPLIDGCETIDALSDFEFYKKGLINTPVTVSDRITPFLENKIENQWVYYCCAQYNGVGNRLMAMPSYRNRILGLQMYKYNIKGFLHWGYNFYKNEFARKNINPYVTTSGDQAFPSGDAFSVYPVNNGVIPSLRAIIFKEALNDIEICRTLESFIGRDKVIEMIDAAAGMNLTFAEYPRNNEFVPSLIEEMEKEIKKHI